MWSLGCVVIEMASGNPPWSEMDFENPFRALYHIGNSEAIPRIPEALSEAGRQFLKRCLTRDPDKRPDAATLLNDPWLQVVHSFCYLLARRFSECVLDASLSVSSHVLSVLHVFSPVWLSGCRPNRQLERVWI